MARYAIYLKPSANRQLAKLPQDVQRRIVAAVDDRLMILVIRVAHRRVSRIVRRKAR